MNNLKSVSPFLDIICYHHERWDGKGYPEGLKGKEVPIEARILSVADSIDAMFSNRPYRKGMITEDVKNVLDQNKGKQWDEKLIGLVLDNNLLDYALKLQKYKNLNEVIYKEDLFNF
ncbi:Cyclic di-GMP phosphodiesterase response regulator RpfG [Natranaerofaba carboxydovora]|nr:HD domain-containing phosphohydrolase [Natranaerofaba carboxydovora]UMZ74220.1 Cyclic di-GMP phosphodiesterase response regulator RpfG [Natranaerofaba carboxydovora]